MYYIILIMNTIPYSNLFKDETLWEYSRNVQILDHGLKGVIDMEKKIKSRRVRFETYREDRVRKAVAAIKLCQNMSNKNSYEYTEEEGKKIISYIREALRDLEHAFKKSTKKEDVKYFD
jgi:5-carboxymethyl-2-hydroxymuconate isomerase